jgi:serine/threonine protein kinase
MWHDHYVVKVGDFGMAVQLGENGASTFGGTLPFMAPEILRAKANQSNNPFRKRLDATRETKNGNGGTNKDKTKSGEDQPGSVDAGAADDMKSSKDPKHVEWAAPCDMYSVGMTMMCLSLGIDKYIPEGKYEHTLQKRIEMLQKRLETANNSLSKALVKLICQCLDPTPDRRPTALDFLAVSLKGLHAKKVLPSSLSFWKALASRRDSAAQSIVGRTVNRFATDYLHEIEPNFTKREACIIMGLISRYQESRVLHTASKNAITVGFETNTVNASLSLAAGRLVQGLHEDETAATILHAIASLPPNEKFIRQLAWDVTGWPFHPSLHRFALHEDGQHFRPAMIAALNGDESIARKLLEIE